MPTTRREFLKRASAIGVGALASSAIASTLSAEPQTSTKVIAISSGNGIRAVTKAIDMIRSG
ncbi:MAG: twin-arginine translocation signal domain-containing protein, partial [Bacteroidota bacterium]